MKRAVILLCFSLMLSAPADASFFEDDTPNPCVMGPGASFEPVFSSTGALSPAVVNDILSAKKSIRVALRALTSKPVAEALVKASRAKVDVKIVLNKKGTKDVTSGALFLRTMSVPPHLTKADDGLSSAYIIIDEKDVILGNIAGFVDEEEERKSAGSALVIHNAPDLAKRYLADWQKQWDKSEPMLPEKN